MLFKSIYYKIFADLKDPEKRITVRRYDKNIKKLSTDEKYCVAYCLKVTLKKIMDKILLEEQIDQITK